MDEQISEEAVYQEDDQGGYSLRSRMIAPPKKNVVPAKQPTALAKKVTVPPKMMVVIPKQLQNLVHSSTSDPIQLKAQVQEVRFLDKLHYSFNLESEIHKLKIPFPLIELMKNDSFKSLVLKSIQPKI